MQENDDVSEGGPDDVDGNVADTEGDGALGDRTVNLGLRRGIGRLTHWPFDRGNISKNATSTTDASLGLSAGRSSLQGNDDVSEGGPNDVDGNVADTDDTAHWATVPSTFDCDGASDD